MRKKSLLLLSLLIGINSMLCAYTLDKYINTDSIKSFDTAKIDQNIHAITCTGDTMAYKKLMLQIPYYDYFVYSIYMASKYDYALAYYNAYRIYYRWLNLYDTQIDTISWDKLGFWLQWGVDAGSSICRQILCDSIYNDDSIYATLDSLNGFVFMFPLDNNSSDSLKATLPGERNISISKEQFEICKKQRLCCNDSTSKRTLETYAYDNKHSLDKYIITNDDVFSTNENFLFRVHEQLNVKGGHGIVLPILWHLSNTYMLCADFFSTFNNKLGLYLLQLGYKDGDNYAALTLAQLYAEGRYVPQNIEYAEKILTSLMSEDSAKKMVQRWINRTEEKAPSDLPSSVAVPDKTNN